MEDLDRGWTKPSIFDKFNKKAAKKDAPKAAQSTPLRRAGRKPAAPRFPFPQSIARHGSAARVHWGPHDGALSRAQALARRCPPRDVGYQCGMTVLVAIPAFQPPGPACFALH